MLNRLIAVIAVFLAVASPVKAQGRWLNIVRGEDKVDLDTTQIKTLDGGISEVWLRWRFAKAQTYPGEKPSMREVERVQVSCEPRRMRRMQGVRYNRGGDVVGSYDAPLDWREGAVPDSYGEQVYISLCYELEHLAYMRSRSDTTKR
jgi:hypothetical protein